MIYQKMIGRSNELVKSLVETNKIILFQTKQFVSTKFVSTNPGFQLEPWDVTLYYSVAPQVVARLVGQLLMGIGAHGGSGGFNSVLATPNWGPRKVQWKLSVASCSAYVIYDSMLETWVQGLLLVSHFDGLQHETVRASEFFDVVVNQMKPAVGSRLSSS